MLQKYDDDLITARSLCIVWTILKVLGILAGGICMAVMIHWAYIFLILVGWLFCWITWVILRVVLSYFCDVKMIRNKLYDEGNDGLAEFLSGANHSREAKKSPIVVSKAQKEQNELMKSLSASKEYLELKQQFESGGITPVEFETRKEELLRNMKGGKKK